MKNAPRSGKRKPTKKKSEIKLLTLRLEAMELRESMLKERLSALGERLERFGRNENAMSELHGSVVELKSSFQVIYRSIENLRDDLRRNRKITELPEPA